MENSVINKQHIHEFTENGIEYKLVIDYGLNRCGGQEAYFSMTSDLFENRLGYWRLISCGCQHDLVRQHVPELAHLIKWHLCSVERGPMHYEANGLFWWERSLMKEQVPMYRGDNCAIGAQAFEHFKTTVVYGVTKKDTIFMDTDWDKSNITKEDLCSWMRKRHSDVMKAFRKDMRKHGLLKPIKKTCSKG